MSSLQEWRRPVLPQKFTEVLAAAGIIDQTDRISELRIIAKPGQMVTIEVTYIADQRILALGQPEQPEQPESEPVP